MSSDYWWYHSCETDLGRNLVYPPGAQRVWLSLVRQGHVSVYNSEQNLGIGMGRTRDMMAEIAEAVGDVIVATDDWQTADSEVGPGIPPAHR